MSRCHQVGRPIARCLRQTQLPQPLWAPSRVARGFSSTAGWRDDQASTTKTAPKTASPEEAAVQQSESQQGQQTQPSTPQSRKPNDTDFKRRKLDPNVTTLRWAEQVLMKRGTPPIGSRRRRVAVRTSQNIPFEQLPYQCFQEARKILQADRKEKLQQIVSELERIKSLEVRDPRELKGGEHSKQLRLRSMRQHVERLKILADINDPEVKRRFEDGLGDMTKPIYRYLAERKWRGQPLRLINQRISQFHIVPDLLPKFEPKTDVQLFFRGKKFSPGETIDSLVSENPPSLRVQVFDSGERLVTIAVVDSDVPDAAKDGFSRRCHFLAANIPLDPTRTSIPLSHIRDEQGQLAIPWLPPFSQRGAPYHRLSIFVLEQTRDRQTNESVRVDVAQLRDAYCKRDGFSIKSLRDKFPVEPVGFNLFRTVWDDHTAEVMKRHGIPGADIEFKRVRYESLKPPRKARGWEAKRQGPKYRHLWKYTHRIATPKRKFVR